MNAFCYLSFIKCCRLRFYCGILLTPKNKVLSSLLWFSVLPTDTSDEWVWTRILLNPLSLCCQYSPILHQFLVCSVWKCNISFSLYPFLSSWLKFSHYVQYHYCFFHSSVMCAECPPQSAPFLFLSTVGRMFAVWKMLYGTCWPDLSRLGQTPTHQRTWHTRKLVINELSVPQRGSGNM